MKGLKTDQKFLGTLKKKYPIELILIVENSKAKFLKVISNFTLTNQGIHS